MNFNGKNPLNLKMCSTALFVCRSCGSEYRKSLKARNKCEECVHYDMRINLQKLEVSKYNHQIKMEKKKNEIKKSNQNIKNILSLAHPFFQKAQEIYQYQLEILMEEGLCKKDLLLYLLHELNGNMNEVRTWIKTRNIF